MSTRSALYPARSELFRISGLTVGLLVIAGVLAAAVVPSAATSVDWTQGVTQLVSVNSSGTGSGNGYSDDPIISRDGSMVAFHSLASDLDGATPDTNGSSDIYVRHLTNGVTELVSINSAGTAAGGAEGGQVFSPDGSMIAFHGTAANLVAGVSPGGGDDVLVRDLSRGVTSLVSVNAAGTDRGNNESWNPVFSPDGSKIAFLSRASDLDPTIPDTNGVVDVYLRDLQAGTTSLVSVNSAGTAAGNGGSRRGLAFSPDSTMLAFATESSDLDETTNDSNGVWDIYVRNLITDNTRLVSVNGAGTAAGDHWAMHPAFSPDGSMIAFNSTASDLDPTIIDTNTAGDVYVRDLEAGETRCVSVNYSGTNAGQGDTFGFGFSPDSTKIAFESSANDLVEGAPSGGAFVRNLSQGVTRVISHAGYGPTFVSDSDTVVFSSGTAEDPSIPDTNGHADTYVKDLVGGVTHLLTVNATDTDAGNGQSGPPGFSANSDAMAFTSLATDLDDSVVDTNGEFDVYVRIFKEPACTIRGTSGDDTLMGTDRDDIICGGGGDDTIYGLEGDDELRGGAGNDELFGGSGDDTILGHSGNDTIYGGGGADTVDGGRGADTIVGGRGNDTLNGGAQADTIYGGGGADTVDGGRGADTIVGGRGGDMLNGGAQADTIRGQSGKDTIKGNGGADRLFGGSWGDKILGGSGSDLLKGQRGADHLEGNRGDDTLFGGAGDDELFGGGGTDVCKGGLGDDLLVSCEQAAS